MGELSVNLSTKASHYSLLTTKALAIGSIVTAIALIALASIQILPWHTSIFPAIGFSVSLTLIGLQQIDFQALRLKSTSPHLPPSPPAISGPPASQSNTSTIATTNTLTIPKWESLSKEIQEKTIRIALTDVDWDGGGGTSVEYTLLFFIHYLKQYNASSELINTLELAIFIYKLLKQKNIQEAENLIFNNLKQGKEVIFPGGWLNENSGHTVMLRFIPLPEEQVSVEIFNTGSGIAFLQGTIKGHHLRQPRGCRLPEIKVEELNNNRCIERITQFLTHSINKDSLIKENSNPGYTADEWFSLLNESWPSPAPRTLFRYGSCQRGDTCSAKSPMAYLLERLDNDFRGEKQLAPSRQFKCWLKNEAIKDYLQKPPHSWNLDWLETILIKNSVSLQKFHKKTPDKKDRSATNTAWAEKVQTWRTAIIEERTRRLKQETVPLQASAKPVTAFSLGAQSAPPPSTQTIAQIAPVLTSTFDINNIIIEWILIKKKADAPEENLVVYLKFLRHFPPAQDPLWNNLKDEMAIDNVLHITNNLNYEILNNLGNKAGTIELPSECLLLIIRSWMISWKIASSQQWLPPSFLEEQKEQIAHAFNQALSHERFLDPDMQKEWLYLKSVLKNGKTPPNFEQGTTSIQLFKKTLPETWDPTDATAEEHFLLACATQATGEVEKRLQGKTPLERLAIFYQEDSSIRTNQPFTLPLYAYNTTSYIRWISVLLCSYQVKKLKENLDEPLILHLNSREENRSLSLFSTIYNAHLQPVPEDILKTQLTTQQVDLFTKEDFNTQLSKAPTLSSAPPIHILSAAKKHPSLLMSQWIDIFYNDPLLLKDSTYQRLFVQQQSELINCAQNPHQQEILFSFIERAYHHAYVLEDHELFALVFQLHLSFTLHLNHPPITEVFQKKCLSFLEMTDLPKETLYLLGHIAMQGGSFYDCQTAEPTSIVPYLAALRIYQINHSTPIPLPPSISSLMVRYGAQSLMVQLKNSPQLLQKMQNILQLKDPCIIAPNSNEITLGTTSCSLENGSSKGTVSITLHASPLPQEICQHKKFTYLFGNQANFPAFKKPDGWHFTGPHGLSYWIQQTGSGEIEIKRSINSEWCTFFIPGTGTWNGAPPKDHPLIDGSLRCGGLNYWQSPTGTYIENEKNRFLAYSTSEGVEKLSKKGKPKRLFLAQQLPPELSPFLLPLDSPSYIMTWVDKNQQVQEIELPRLQIKIIYRNSRWEIKEYPGFYISEKSELIQLREFTGYLTIQNDKGEKKVIIPYRFFPSEPITPYGPLPRISTEPSEALFAYTINKNKEMLPTGRREEDLFLCYLYLSTRNYYQAIKLLEKATFHTKPFTPAEERILRKMLYTEGSEQISYSTDNHPYAITLRLRIALILQENHHELKKNEQKIYLSDINEYFKKINSVIRFHSETEGRLFKAQTVNPIRPIQPPKAVEPSSMQWLTPSIAEKIKQQKNILPLKNSLRPGAPFVYNFLFYYKLAKSGTPQQKKELAFLLHGCRYDTSETTQSLSRALWYALGEPSAPDLRTVERHLHQPDWLKTHLVDCYQESHKTPLPLPPSYTQNAPIFAKEVLTLSTSSNVNAQKIPLTSSLPLCLLSLIDSGSIIEENFDYNRALKPLETLKTDFDPTIHSEPVVRREFETIQQGITEKITQLPKTRKYISSAALPSLTRQLQDEQESLKKQCESLAESIVQRVNHVSPEEEPFLEFLSQKRDKLSLEEILLLFAQNDDALFFDANPALTDWPEIKKDISNYLLFSTHLFQINRSLDLAQACPTDTTTTPEKQAAEDALFQALSTQRAFNPLDKPHLLVFEYFLRHYLRQNQIDALEKLNKQGLLEACTGFGKSKAIIPCWLATTAQPNHLASIVVPEKLFQEMETNLHQSMRRFSKKLVSLSFDRNQPNRTEALEKIYSQLMLAREKGSPVLLTEKTLHNLLVLLPKEVLSSQQEPSCFITCMKIRAFFKEGSTFFEEPHITLNDVFEFNWSIGKPEPLSPERTTPITHLYAILLNTPVLEPLLSGFLGTEEASIITKKQYDETFKKILVQAVTPDPQLQAYYLDNNPSNFTPTAEQRTLRNQINHYLPTTLTQRYNDRYGILDPNVSRLAIPGEGVGNLQKGSEFSTLDELINFTINSNLRTHFTQDQINKSLDKIVQQNLKEQEKQITSTADTFTHLLSALNLSNLSLDNLDTKAREQIATAINHSLNGRLLWTTLTILPEIFVYKDKIKSSPHLIAQTIGHAVGASGTLGLQNLPQGITSDEDPTTPINTLSKLYEFHQETPITSVKASDTDTFLQTILKEENFSAFIDIGGCCCDMPEGEAVAQAILQHTAQRTSRPSGVLFFKGEGEPWVLMRTTKKAVRLEELSGDAQKNLFYYFGQTYITGVDLSLPVNIQAKASFNGTTQLTAALQGVGRLRGLLINQKCTFVVPHKELSLIRETLNLPETAPITIKEVLQSFIVQQGTKKASINFSSLILQWEALVENAFWKYAEENYINNTQSVYTEFKKMRSLLVEPIKDISLLEDIVTRKRPIAQVVEEMKAQFLKTIENLPLDIKKITKEIDKTINIEKLPLEACSSEAKAKTQITQAAAQAQTQTTTIQQNISLAAIAQQTQQSATATQQLAVGLSPFKPKKRLYAYNPLVTAPSVNSLLKKTLFSNTLTASQEFFRLATDEEQAPSLEKDRLKPLQYCHLEFSKEGNLIRFTLLDLDDAADLQAAFPQGNHALWQMNLGLVTLGKNATITKESIKTSTEFKNLQMQAKALNGDFLFSEEELKLFTAWVASHKKDWLALLPHILKTRPNALTRIDEKRRRAVQMETEKI